VFLVSVPFGLFGTIWAYLKLVDNGIRIPAKIDWLGNAAFAVGLIALLTGIVYSLLPYGGRPTGWTNPWVLTAIFGGIAVLGLFVWIELHVPEPMFRLSLFKIRAFTAGNIAGLLGALGHGAVNGPVLHHRHPRTGLAPAQSPVQGARRGRSRSRRGPHRGQRAADRQPVLGLPRLQQRRRRLAEVMAGRERR